MLSKLTNHILLQLSRDFEITRASLMHAKNWRLKSSRNAGKLLYESKIDFLMYNNGTGQKSFERHLEMEYCQLMSFMRAW